MLHKDLPPNAFSSALISRRELSWKTNERGREILIEYTVVHRPLRPPRPIRPRCFREEEGSLSFYQEEEVWENG